MTDLNNPPSEFDYDALLGNVLDNIVRNNQDMKPGMPLAELRAAIETAVASLPPLQFDEFSTMLDDTDAINDLIVRAPEIIGWDADKIIEWLEDISKKL